jgi:hypothetical protein
MRAEGPYPQGTEWRCRNGHTYPEDFEPVVCPEDGFPLTRVAIALIPEDEEPPPPPV